MKRKICPHCKADNPEIAVFCKKCGALFQGYPEYIDPVKEKNKVKNAIVFAVCVLLLIVALIVFKSGSSDAATTVAETTASPATTVISVETTATATAPATTTAAAPIVTPTPITTTAANSTTAAVLNDTASILEKYNSLIKDIKAEKGSITIHKTEKIALEITEFSLPAPMSAINSFMAKLIPETDITYSFSNGVAAEDSKVTLSGLIPPTAKESAEVKTEDLLKATHDANGTVNLEFKADSSSFADGQTVFPLYVGSATDVLDFATFALGPVKIVSAEIDYPGTKITAETDENGRLKKLTIYQPVNVISTGGVGSLTADVGMKLQATTTFEIK